MSFKFRKVLLFYTMLSVFCTLFASAVPAAPAHTKVARKGRSSYSQPTSYRRNKVFVKPTQQEMGDFNKIQNFIRNRDINGLKESVKGGLNLEIQNGVGDTPICLSIKRNDYTGFSMLKSVGANLAPNCMKEIPVDQRQEFIARYMELGGHLSLAAQDSILETKELTILGADANMVAASALVVGTGAALIGVAAGGGGGSSKKSTSAAEKIHPDDKPDIPPSGTTQTDPGYYVTNEFSGTHFPNANNFLSQINAQYAYATAAANGQPIAGDGVIVGVIDNGVDVNHRELKDNILRDSDDNIIGLNRNYGPCRGDDTTSCWKLFTNVSTPYAILYNSAGSQWMTETAPSDPLEQAGWLLSYVVWEASFPADWDWDEHKGDPSPASSVDNHGTHVAGIIAAAKDNYGMHGVAYNAKIIGVNSGFLGWYSPAGVKNEEFKYVVDNGAQVINNSWGSRGEKKEAYMDWNVNTTKSRVDSEEQLAIKYAADRGVITVFSAGNERSSHPTWAQNPLIESGIPMKNPNLLYYRDSNTDTLKKYSSYPTVSKDSNGVVTSDIASSLLVTVVSVDAKNNLTSYSNQCGAAASWCIAAPGGDGAGTQIVSSVPSDEIPDDYYEGMSGTSMAAPVVSGALATILGAAPSLKPEEAVEILFNTATDLGAPGVDIVYGHGLVNLKEALNPQGTTTLALGDTASSNQVSFSGTHITVPHIYEQALLEQMPQTLVILDEYKRAYNVPTTSILRTTSHSKQAFANNLRSFTRWQRPAITKLSDTIDMSFSENPQAFSNEKLNGVSMAFGYHTDNITANFSFMQNAKEGMENYFNQSLMNPFTTSAKDVYAIQNSFALTKKLNVGFGGSIGKNNFFDGNERLDYRHERSMKTGEVNLNYQPVDFARLNVLGGMLEEKGALLGMNGFGGLKTDDGQTYFMGAQLSVEPMEKVRLSAAYYYGLSRMKNQTSALMSLSDVQSESMAFKAEYQFDEDVLLGVRSASPLHIRKATATFNLPVARDATEDIVYRERVTASLKPQAKEWDWGIFGVYNVNAWTFQTEALTRINPDNQANSRPDYRLMFSVGFGY